MNLQKLKKAKTVEISKKQWLINSYQDKIKKIKRELEIIDWMILDWGAPPYDTSGSLKTRK